MTSCLSSDLSLKTINRHTINNAAAGIIKDFFSILKFTNIHQNQRWIIYMRTLLGRKNWRGGFSYLLTAQIFKRKINPPDN